MKIILSPAKKMNMNLDSLQPLGLPKFIDQTEVILSWLKSKSYEELKKLWGCRLYEAVRDESGIIINLASREYSKCIEKYLMPEDRYITITFCEKSGDKLVTKGTYAKMARGEMVRFMAQNHIENPVEIQKFDRLGYVYREELSSDTELVFEREPVPLTEKESRNLSP